MAAGDIACGSESARAQCAQQQTSDLILTQSPDAVLALGDSQYECGTAADFAAYFDPTWGRFKDRIHPAVGNHEYHVGAEPDDSNCVGAPAGAGGYYSYFGDAASPLEPGCTVKCEGYYSWDIGAWHLIALNDQCSHVGGCNKGSPEEVWLENDLASHQGACTIAYFHEPRWSSGSHGSITGSAAFWDDLYAAGVELVLNGHDHDYERFAPQDPSGVADAERGIREFVVGTGGRNHTGLSKGGRIANSEMFDYKTFGALKLTLRPDGYDWEFEGVDGSAFHDSGSDRCH
jgi:calcineurin-like phosphoesterase family protein